MKTEKIMLANLKCDGCATTIRKELLKLGRIKDIVVDVDNDFVSLTYDDIERNVIVDKLHSLGYPEATEKNGLLLQLKSYASCMIGRINNL